MAQVKITVRNNGPFRVEAAEGSIEMIDADGKPYDLSTKVKEGQLAFSLCRCGDSANKPFCDGMHKVKYQTIAPTVKVEQKPLP
jgi:CDGSH-type Zn-finger protein